MRRITVAAACALVLVLLAVIPTFADQVYHSERLDFALTLAGAGAGHPVLRHGQVVNIHPNGPVIGALERYMVIGAKPNTSYAVRLEAFAGGCEGDPALSLITVTLDTNANGSAHGQ